MAEEMQRLHNSAYVIFRELCTGEVRRNPLPRTRVNERLGPSFSNSLPIEIMAPLSHSQTHPLFSYI